jgi:hypothetical protein
MVISGDWKLALYHGYFDGELYNLAEDPKERYNLFNDRRWAEKKSEMLIRLCNKTAWTADPLPEREGKF